MPTTIKMRCPLVRVTVAVVLTALTSRAPCQANAAAPSDAAPPLDVNVVSLGCVDDEDCELLGECRANGVCVCAPGFTGPTCGQLDLAPADASTRGRVWPSNPQPAGPSGQIAWSFAPVYDPVRCAILFV
jgi:hypothetical protein